MTEVMLYPVGHELRFDVPPHPGGYELRRTLRGHSFYVWRKRVPRISDQILDCVIYLYPSVAAAQAGEAAGGTGFLVAVPSEVVEHGYYVYAVTNSHVIREGASPVIRLNTKDGGMDVIPLSQEHWVHHQDGDDLAACSVGLANDRHKYKFVTTDQFLTKEIVEERNIGPGDDVYMVGRFVTHDGKQRNTPSARFGNISMMPWEPIPHSRGIDQEAFLVETRSLSGYSGSPVFVQIIANWMRPDRDGVNRSSGQGGWWLLGVDYGHLPVRETVVYKDDKMPVDDNWMVESNSGQMAVVPAWRLQDLLDQEDFAVPRKRDEESLAKRKESSPVVLDRQIGGARETEQADTDSNVFSRSDFFRDLKKAARKQDRPSQPDSETR